MKDYNAPDKKALEKEKQIENKLKKEINAFLNLSQDIDYKKELMNNANKYRNTKLLKLRNEIEKIEKLSLSSAIEDFKIVLLNTKIKKKTLEHYILEEMTTMQFKKENKHYRNLIVKALKKCPDHFDGPNSDAYNKRREVRLAIPELIDMGIRDGTIKEDVKSFLNWLEKGELENHYLVSAYFFKYLNKKMGKTQDAKLLEDYLWIIENSFVDHYGRPTIELAIEKVHYCALMSQVEIDHIESNKGKDKYHKIIDYIICDLAPKLKSQSKIRQNFRTV